MSPFELGWAVDTVLSGAYTYIKYFLIFILDHVLPNVDSCSMDSSNVDSSSINDSLSILSSYVGVTPKGLFASKFGIPLLNKKGYLFDNLCLFSFLFLISLQVNLACWLSLSYVVSLYFHHPTKL